MVVLKKGKWVILSILDLKQERTRIIISIISCIIFSFIYELFSHGVISFYMCISFIFPLLLLIEVLIIIKKKINIKVISHNLFKSGILTFTIYFVIMGVLEIYGTTNSLVIVYPMLGLSLLVLSIIIHLKKD